jgi:small conductance mechanosensitive channel
MNNLSFNQLLNWQTYWQTILTTFGLRLVGAIALFLAGRWGALLVQKAARKLLIKARVEVSLVSFVSNCAYYGTVAFIALAIMGILGIETTSLIAVLGATSVAIGLALQGSLSNFAAGLLLIIFHPFRVDDWIEGASVSGIVEEIQFFTTHVRTPDNRLVIIPNGKLTNDNVTNYSAKGMLRVDMVVGVDYEENLQRIKKLIVEVLDADPYVLTDPKPTIGVMDLGENDIRLAVQPWTAPENFWNVRYQTCEHLVERFRQEGIQTPSNRPEIHIHSLPQTA